MTKSTTHYLLNRRRVAFTALSGALLLSGCAISTSASSNTAADANASNRASSNANGGSRAEARATGSANAKGSSSARASGKSSSKYSSKFSGSSSVVFTTKSRVSGMGKAKTEENFKATVLVGGGKGKTSAGFKAGGSAHADGKGSGKADDETSVKGSADGKGSVKVSTEVKGSAKGEATGSTKTGGKGASNAEKAASGKGEGKPGKDDAKPAKGDTKPGKDGKGNAKPGKGNAKPGKDGKGEAKPGKGSSKPGKDGKGDAKPGKGNVKPGKGDSKPGKDDRSLQNEAPSEKPIVVIEPPEAPPENVFGYETPVRGCFEGVVYPLAPNTQSLPTDFSALTGISVVYACEWDIPTRKWDTGFPGVEDHFEWFAIQYSGSFNIQTAGKWKFRISSDDGAKMFIDGKLILDNDGVHPPKEKVIEVDLAAGDHKMVLEYFQGPRYHINLQLFATPPGGVEGVFSVR